MSSSAWPSPGPFVNQPSILLCDEPTGNLDPATQPRHRPPARPDQPDRHDDRDGDPRRRHRQRHAHAASSSWPTGGRPRRGRRLLRPQRRQAQGGQAPKSRSRRRGGGRMRVGFMLGEVWNGLRRNISMAVSVILVTMVSMFLLGLGLLAQRQADTWKGYWYDRVQVSIYLCNSDAAQPNCAEPGGHRRAEGRDQGRSSTEDAGGQEGLLRVRAGGLRPVQGAVPQQPGGEQRPEGRRHPGRATGSSSRTRPSSPSWPAPSRGPLASLRSRTRRRSSTSSCGSSTASPGSPSSWRRIMVLCAVLLMVTTIRQAAFTRRREIGIMRLVGASNFTIRHTVHHRDAAVRPGRGGAWRWACSSRRRTSSSTGCCPPCSRPGARSATPTSGSSRRGWPSWWSFVAISTSWSPCGGTCAI